MMLKRYINNVYALVIAGFILASWSGAHSTGSEVIGYVKYQFHILRDDRIVVEVIDDPKVKNISCYISRAVIGGASGMVGVATDPSRESIACRAVGPVSILKPIDESQSGEEVFDQSQNFGFKELKVTRFVDRQRKVLVYLVWSTRLFQGTPFNSVTAIPLER